ncbi:hypothetical protein VTJ04DRAFT_4774 [Mycothermus thermophilus]|uniref:uncharacterized protein n=1 Tax=Humicola insolens TaxID=85995 RepID=UPI00374317B4
MKEKKRKENTKINHITRKPGARRGQGYNVETKTERTPTTSHNDPRLSMPTHHLVPSCAPHQPQHPISQETVKKNPSRCCSMSPAQSRQHPSIITTP